MKLYWFILSLILISSTPLFSQQSYFLDLDLEPNSSYSLTSKSSNRVNLQFDGSQKDLKKFSRLYSVKTEPIAINITGESYDRITTFDKENDGLELEFVRDSINFDHSSQNKRVQKEVNEKIAPKPYVHGFYDKVNGLTADTLSIGNRSVDPFLQYLGMGNLSHIISLGVSVPQGELAVSESFDSKVLLPTTLMEFDRSVRVLLHSKYTLIEEKDGILKFDVISEFENASQGSENVTLDGTGTGSLYYSLALKCFISLQEEYDLTAKTIVNGVQITERMNVIQMREITHLRR